MQESGFKIIYQNGEWLCTGEPVDLDVVFNCGQCFRFEKDAGGYVGVARKRVFRVRGIENGFVCSGSVGDEYFLRNFFDLEQSYRNIENRFKKDPVLAKAVEYAAGMRLLNQEPFETIITFIISANNHVERIRRIVRNLCARCGEKIMFEEKEYYTFPEPEILAGLTEAEWREVGTGYRAEYLADTVNCIAQGFDLERFYYMEYYEAKAELMKLKGIGPKVADCILLFAYQKKNAFPMDVWMKRVLKELYGFVPKNDREAIIFSEKTFGDCAGIAQQYLFHYMRSIS